MRLLEGSPHVLGASWDGRGTNFALFSANAEKVELCLFDRQGRREIERIALPERTDDIWHGYLPEVARGQVYGYRVYGPYDPAHGHRFNPNKLLLDPYAKRVIGPFVWNDAHFGYRTKSARLDLSFDRRDNARSMLKAVVVDPSFTWGKDRRPEHAMARNDHLRGACQRPDHAARRRAAAVARLLQRACGAPDYRSSAKARRDRDRAVADPCFHG